MSRNAHSLAARWCVLTASTWTAALQLWQDQSLAYQAAGGSAALYALNVGMLALVALGWTDVVWHDIGGRLIWPSFPARWRHRVCELIYAVLGIMFGIRAFLAMGQIDLVGWVGGYYVVFAVGALVEAWALHKEAVLDLRATRPGVLA